MIAVDAFDRGVNAVGTVTTLSAIARTRTTATTDATAVRAVATPSDDGANFELASDGVCMPRTVRRLDERRIGKLLIEYHPPILKERGITFESVDRGIVGRGYQAILGSLTDGYVLYGQS